VPQGRRRG